LRLYGYVRTSFERNSKKAAGIHSTKVVKKVNDKRLKIKEGGNMACLFLPLLIFLVINKRIAFECTVQNIWAYWRKDLFDVRTFVYRLSCWIAVPPPLADTVRQAGVVTLAMTDGLGLL